MTPIGEVVRWAFKITALCGIKRKVRRHDGLEMIPLNGTSPGRLAARKIRCYCPLTMAALMIGATDSAVIPRSMQYLVVSHLDTDFWPLLALQPRQHNAMFSLVMMVSSLMMCSQLAENLADSFGDRNSQPQYTQELSLARTSVSSQVGIFQLFAIPVLLNKAHNV